MAIPKKRSGGPLDYGSACFSFLMALDLAGRRREMPSWGNRHVLLGLVMGPEPCFVFRNAISN